MRPQPITPTARPARVKPPRQPINWPFWIFVVLTVLWQLRIEDRISRIESAVNDLIHVENMKRYR